MKNLIGNVLAISITIFVVVCFFVAINHITSCTSPINVNVRIRKGNDTYKCTQEVHNSDGTTTFQSCGKLDGQEPVDQKATDAPDNIQSFIIIPAHSRLN